METRSKLKDNICRFGVTATFTAIASFIGSQGAQAQDAPPSWCGTEPIRIGHATGAGGDAWRQIARVIAEDEASRCPNVSEVLYADAQLNPQKAISDIQGFVTQGVDVIVLFGDAGQALLPAIRSAHEAGVSIVPYNSDVGGTAGEDYTDIVLPDNEALGTLWGEWIAETLDDQGTIVFLGGTPGNPTDRQIYEAALAVIETKPGMEMVGGVHMTNYNAAESQQLVTGLIAQYPEIDGIISSYGGQAIGALRAFEIAGRPIPALATTDLNEIGCLFQELKPTNPSFELLAVASYTFQVRTAIRKGIAGLQGVEVDEPSIQPPVVLEDSTLADMQPGCDEELPMDVPLSADLPRDQLQAIFAGN